MTMKALGSCLCYTLGLSMLVLLIPSYAAGSNCSRNECSWSWAKLTNDGCQRRFWLGLTRFHYHATDGCPEPLTVDDDYGNDCEQVFGSGRDICQPCKRAGAVALVFAILATLALAASMLSLGISSRSESRDKVVVGGAFGVLLFSTISWAVWVPCHQKLFNMIFDTYGYIGYATYGPCWGIVLFAWFIAFMYGPLAHCVKRMKDDSEERVEIQGKQVVVAIPAPQNQAYVQPQQEGQGAQFQPSAPPVDAAPVKSVTVPVVVPTHAVPVTAQKAPQYG
mmetsp:Transcript_21114/g.42486  ORF Transcript_21114/g.42486 Transcript_21114/m.42486 type:complete len:279 (-) Transcript_21114:339-1175(-)